MPPRKEPKETVVYPASKRKVPAFKPLRPSKAPRIPTTESDSSNRSQSVNKTAPAREPAARKNVKSIAIPDSEDDDGDDDDGIDELAPEHAAIDEGNATEQSRPAKPASNAKRKAPVRDLSPMSASSDPPNPYPPTTTARAKPLPSQPDDSPSSIPQPLLLRLMHESFTDKNTKIDTTAIQVFQHYIEIFIREAIARAQLEKSEAAERGEVSETDARWLEVEDLEKALPGLMLDF